MINYEDLRMAHDLAVKLGIDLKMEVRVYHGDYAFGAHLYNPKTKLGSMFNKVDKLLKELKEMSRTNAKYKVGQTIWRLNDEYEPQSMEICDIDLDSEEMYLDENDNWWVEEQLYPTKSALIESELSHWAKLYEEENPGAFVMCKQDMVADNEPKSGARRVCEDIFHQLMESSTFGEKVTFDLAPACQHESDGMIYCSNPPQNKCLKCGEFYR